MNDIGDSRGSRVCRDSVAELPFDAKGARYEGDVDYILDNKVTVENGVLLIAQLQDSLQVGHCVSVFKSSRCVTEHDLQLSTANPYKAR